MKGLKNKMAVGVRIVVIVSAILLGPAIFTYAANTDEFGIISFSPGTTISSSQVNNNFQALINAMPRLADSFLSSGTTTLSSTPQSIASLTATPPADGLLLLIASIVVNLESGTLKEPALSAADAHFCIAQTPNACSPSDHGAFCGLDAATYPYLTTNWQSLNIFAPMPCKAHTPVTFYLNAWEPPPSAGLCTIYQATMYAIFLPGGSLNN